MREKILEKATEMFVNLGFKSVTMDDIAQELGVSKKTIYKYFKNKYALVFESATTFHQSCSMVINKVVSKHFNPIQESFEIKKVFKEMFQNADSSPVYQLKKYYPDVYDKAMEKEKVIFYECLRSNLERGIREEFYRKDINIQSVIHFYFTLVFSIYENTLNYKDVTHLELQALEYHIRAIATLKGIQELNTILLQQNEA